MSTELSQPKRLYDIAPIPTFYKGIEFRSRLEIRWAVYFDRLSWTWIYEPKKFKLPTANYIPDFYFPEFNCYAEVKPNDLNMSERIKAVELSMLLPEVVIMLLIGLPELNCIQTIQNGGKGFVVVPMPSYNKFAPFFCTDVFDPNYFDETTDAVLESHSYEF